MEIEIKRSMPDKGRYFLQRGERRGDLVEALVKRIGVDSVGYTLTESDLSTGLMRELGYSENGPEAITAHRGEWFELVPGSSKSDLYLFLKGTTK